MIIVVIKNLINMDCVFCSIIKENKNILFKNDLAVAFFDGTPVSKGHTLIIPIRHVRTFFDLTKEEVVAIYELAIEAKNYLDDLYHPDGYNIGFNVEEAGGQSVYHCHMHIIPRYLGDTPHPRGGIRKVIKI